MAAALLALLIAFGAQTGLAQANSFGAIAYSNTSGGYGYSYGYSSRGAAEQRALGECRSRGGRNCQVVMWFANQCAALATGNSYGWGVGMATTRQQASNIAMRYCRQNDRGCQVRETVCSR